MKEELELRMYFFVPYQLTGIQQGIQCGHAALEYANRFHDTELYQNFVRKHKTWVILNGGTTNSNRQDNVSEYVPCGTLNQLYVSILNYNTFSRKIADEINVEKFYEPDLQDALTAICFILDERVFNKKKYPNFNSYLVSSLDDVPCPEVYTSVGDTAYTMDYEKWVNYVGGPTNVFLRNLIEGKRLA